MKIPFRGLCLRLRKQALPQVKLFTRRRQSHFLSCQGQKGALYSWGLGLAAVRVIMGRKKFYSSLVPTKPTDLRQKQHVATSRQQPKQPQVKLRLKSNWTRLQRSKIDNQGLPTLTSPLKHHKVGAICLTTRGRTWNTASKRWSVRTSPTANWKPLKHLKPPKAKHAVTTSTSNVEQQPVFNQINEQHTVQSEKG